MHARVGTGDRSPVEFFTFGVLRWTLDPVSGALTAEAVEEPTGVVLKPQFFPRLSGDRWQLCVRMPSGITQIIATDP